MGIEDGFDVSFTARLTSQEKQIQQNYRPVIGVHKWFARRPGSMFRALLLSEFNGARPLSVDYFESHQLEGVTILDPFMGGGTTLLEANRLGCSVIGADVNAMSYWVVRQELSLLDRMAFRAAAEAVIEDVEREIGALYVTACEGCGRKAPVKYFLWVKQEDCQGCGASVDLFPGHLVATDDRHTHFVLHCPGCEDVCEVDELPERGKKVTCTRCRHRFEWAEGSASRGSFQCRCGGRGRYPNGLKPPRHRLFALEYHCRYCRDSHSGRWFKAPDKADLARFARAVRLRRKHRPLPCPDDEVPLGDETRRLHRWGYRRYREMFNERQLLSLGLLLRGISKVEDQAVRHALATVFSDFLRYQNMLCRYDTYALKCQDIFSVHGFPVGLVQCENAVLGIAGVGSGAFRHFVEKYDRAKAYCEHPFETAKIGRGRKRVIHTHGESIGAKIVSRSRELEAKRGSAFLLAGSAEKLKLEAGSISGVFTDPPYFDNVQYAELMDFCYVWLRLLLPDVKEFAAASTRSPRELTGNVTSGRNLAHFTEGLSAVFVRAARTLLPGGPFVFTYHHNDVVAYVPVVVAILDAELRCTATLPCPAEMTASLHINGTGSSVVDTIVVCRRGVDVRPIRTDEAWLRAALEDDTRKLQAAAVKVTKGDLYCLALGHCARAATTQLVGKWNQRRPLAQRMALAEASLRAVADVCKLEEAIAQTMKIKLTAQESRTGEALQLSMLDEAVDRAHREDLSLGG